MPSQLEITVPEVEPIERLFRVLLGEHEQNPTARLILLGYEVLDALSEREIVF